ncbi:helix-turn-helix transcriptional regulator [Nocardioides anomalus]|uniref:helix-turn-helix transcriptional regulator n=1 Tax=Nocardioides anomalus TaxID=2712223 RepID=UPI001E5C449F|nr:helix-turn-helix transcriptional regulator [Nocardioides anomalus]
MPTTRPRGLGPLLALCAALVLVTTGLAQGWWLPNLHNGLLGLSFTAVGGYVLHQRPGHLEGRLMLAAGLVESVLFLGRQLGHGDTVAHVDWWAWAGVWPVPLAIGLTTLAVLCFPDGRLPSARWTPVALVVVGLALLAAAVSALWPVGYAAADLTTAHPLTGSAPSAVSRLWDVVVLPFFAACQLLWVVALVVRWRDAADRRPLVWLVAGAGVSAGALVVGLAVAGSARAGLLTTPLVPLAAGLAIVHGQQAAAYSALSWLSRAEPHQLPAALARATAEALRAPAASLWLGPADRLAPVGLWPETGPEPEPSTLPTLAAAYVVRPVGSGALVVERTDPLSRAEERLLDDLARQAELVLDHLTLRRAIADERRAGHLDGLTDRERDVLELIARGYSNAAICAELHLSVKTVEPAVGSIFAKLGLHADSASNRRVLAALEYVRSAG